MKSIKSRDVHFVGGGKIGFFIASFPFAILFANADRLTLHFGLDTYQFLPHQVTGIIVKKNAIYIKHTIIVYPTEIIFRKTTNIIEIAKQIQQTGFVPCGQITKTITKDNNPFRKIAAIIPILLYALCTVAYFIHISSKTVFQIRNYIPGYTEIFSLIFLIISLIAICKFHFLQNLILKPERYFKEVKLLFISLIEVLCIILAVFVTQFIRNESLNIFFGYSQIVGLIGFSLFFLMPIIRANYLRNN